MVKICELIYPTTDEDKDTCITQFFNEFSYPLHDFQKWSIEATVKGHHTLACAPTGTGKSLCAEFALKYFWTKGKKTIYCSPIKSLSNQKFHDFTQKFPNISIGLITGDIKINTAADVLIMTTEILLNKLYQIKSKSKSKDLKPETNTNECLSSFDVDIETELGCVIFDELHMIGDKDRGHVWENSILMLPLHIQIIGLSATLDNPEKFAAWLESRGIKESIGLENEELEKDRKIVYLTKKLVRPVPLTHYTFITTNSGIFKAIKDKSVQSEIRSLIDKPFTIYDSNGVFNEQNYLNMNKMLKLFATNNIRLTRTHVLNQVSKHLVENEMLPALCFVFSIKQLEKCATELTYPLLEFDSKVPYTIDYECEKILRRLPNYKEYLHLPEYVNLVALLRKGVATHHSKMMPVLREIVEILFARGLIKMLFCTTSVAIGLNLPVRTCLFTNVWKHDGSQLSVLQGHEYVQAAGRAGRLGIDTVGHVIHLNNLFSEIGPISYKTMLKGAPQKLTSNFKISYNLLLNMIDNGDTAFTVFAKRSMIQGDIDSELNCLLNKKGEIEKQQEKNALILSTIKTPLTVLDDYINLLNKKVTAVNKKRREVERAIEDIKTQYSSVEKDLTTYNAIRLCDKNKEQVDAEIEATNQILDNNINTVLQLLQSWSQIEYDSETNGYKLLEKGHIAKQIREVHCIAFSEILQQNAFKTLSVKEIVGILSCFTNVSVSEEYMESISKNSTPVNDCITRINNLFNEYREMEIQKYVNTGMDYTIHFDLIHYIMDWADAETEEECKYILQTISTEKDIFLGEFVKAILKINNISAELERVAETMGDLELLQKLQQIPIKTLKFVATNQSLYV
jgi:superfamily II RNA helicase